MYLEHYNLDREPFHITPDPAFLFLSESHKQALATIIYGIEKKKGFMAVTGAVGVGKTLILRTYLDNHTDGNTKIIYVYNSNTSFEDLIETICQDENIEVVPGNITKTVRNLHLFLAGEYRAGRTVVLIVDEAQNMPVKTLENLRMLSNLETAQDKLLQIVLVGQPEFDAMLKMPELRQLKQRIAMSAMIQRFSPAESLAYIDHRLELAGAMAGSIFEDRALRMIAKEARGIPRLINIFCDNALITACGHGQKTVTPEVVKEVIRDFNRHEGRQFPMLRVAAAAGVVCLIIILFLVVRYARFSSGDAPKTAAVKAAPVPETKAAPDPEANRTEPAPEAAQTRAEPEPVKAAAAKKPDPAAAPKAVAEVTAGQARAKIIATKTVETGDTFSRLAREVYGRTSGAIAKFVQDNNPQIKDVNNLRAGSVVYFPELPKDLAGTPVAAAKKDQPAAAAANIEGAAAQAKQEPPKTDARAGQAQAKIIATKTVGRGDSLSRLTEEVYGRSADEVVKFVQENNPRIKDVNNVPLGSVISFPELPRDMSIRRRTNE